MKKEGIFFNINDKLPPNVYHFFVGTLQIDSKKIRPLTKYDIQIIILLIL